MTDNDGAMQPDDEPVALEAADDSAAILQDTTGRLLRPVLVVVATAGGALLLALGVQLVVRMVKGDVSSSCVSDGARSPA